MRVLHITTNYPTTEYPIFGIFVKEQVESLRQIGIDCDVYYCNGEGRGIRRHITYVPKIWWKIMTGHYDLIHCHHVISAVLLSMTFFAFWKKCILSYQNDPDNEWGPVAFSCLHFFFNGLIIKNNSRFLCKSKTYYLPNGCNEDFFYPMDQYACRKALGWDVEKKYILFMDSNKRVREQKRKDRFDKTLIILRENYGYDVEAVVLRNTPREQIPVIINACNLHLLSSDFEGSPNSVKECMCCNVPVVSTPVGNVKEMIGDIPGNIVTNEFSAEALADAAATILCQKDIYDRRTPFLEKGYGMREVARRLKKLYEEIIYNPTNEKQ